MPLLTNQEQDYSLRPQPGLLSSIASAPKKLFLGALNILDRPRSAVAGLLHGGLVGSTTPGRDFWRGLTGQESISGRRLLRAAGADAGVGSGLVADILLDPVTYATLGVSSAAKGARAGSFFLNRAGRKAVQGATPKIASLLRKSATGDLSALQARDLATGAARASMGRRLAQSPILRRRFTDPGGIKFFGKSIVSGKRIAESGVGRFMKATGKAVRRGELPERLATSRIGAPVQAATKATARISDTLGAMFNPRTIPSIANPDRYKQFIKAEERAKDIGKYFDTRATESAMKMARYAEDLIKAKKIDQNDLSDLLKVIESEGRGASKLKKELAPMLDEMRKFNNEYLTARKRMGKDVIEQNGYKYMAHLFRQSDEQEATKRLLNFVSGQRELTTKTKDDIGRTVLKFTNQKGMTKIGRANDLGLRIKDSKKLHFTNDTGKIFKASQARIDEIAEAGYNISQNPVELFLTMGRRRAVAEMGDNYQRQVFHLTSDKPREGLVQITSDALPMLKGRYVEAAEKAAIEKVVTTLSNEKSINAFWQMYDKLHNWIKAELLLAPSYHVRNSIGNKFNNFIGGVTNPKYYVLAKKLQPKIKRRGAEFYLEYTPKQLGQKIKLGGVEATVEEWIDTIRREGLLDQGLFGIEQVQSITEEVAKKTWKPQSMNNVFFTNNKAFGNYVENSDKIAHILSKFDADGFTIREAATSAKKFLFDYSNLTPFEQNVMKRAIPFYTWLRKNIPLQLTNMIKQPGKYRWMDRLSAISQEEYGEVEQAFNAFGTPIAFRRTPSGAVEYVDLQSFIPAADIFKGLQPGETLLSGITPIAKTPAELISNYSFFTQKPIERFPGETENFLGIPVTKKTATALRTIRPLSEINRANIGGMFGQRPGELSGGPRALRALTGLRSYQYDPELQAQFDQLDYNKIRTQINTNLRRAINGKDWVQARKLFRQLQEMEATPTKATKELLTPGVLKNIR